MKGTKRYRLGALRLLLYQGWAYWVFLKRIGVGNCCTEVQRI